MIKLTKNLEKPGFNMKLSGFVANWTISAKSETENIIMVVDD